MVILNSIKKRRVDVSLKKNFWWTKNHKDQSGLQIEFLEGTICSKIIKEFEYFEATFDEKNKRFLLTHFTNKSNNIEVFFRLCLDIIDFVENFPADHYDNLLDALFRRLEKWESLFKSPVLSFTDSQQIGLLGELSLINDTLLKKFNYKEVLNIWRGPIPEPQDFVSNSWAIEVKAQRTTSEPLVSINSLNQLDIDNGPIFVSHRKFSDSISPSLSNLTLKSQVELILKKIGSDNFYTQYFLGLLDNLGYENDAEYTEKKYALKVSNYYEVKGAFPRLMRSDLPSSIIRGSYIIDLGVLDHFKVPSGALLQRLNK